MNQDCLQLDLLPGPDDPPLNSADFQKSLGNFLNSLQEQGLNPSWRAFTRDTVGGGSTLLGEFFIPLAQTLAPAFFTLLGAWLTARGGRKVRLKIGNIEAEATTVQDVEALLQTATKFQEEKSSEGEGHSS
jgi:hypothetical protein